MMTNTQERLHPKHPDSAWRCPGAHLRLWLIALIGFLFDLVTKAAVLLKLGVPWIQFESNNPQLSQIAPLYRWVIERWGDGTGAVLQEKVWITGLFRFVTVFNPGASWGMAAGKTGLLLGGSLVALIFMFWLFATLHKKQWAAQLALGMIFAGALGNTHDRLFNSGMVVDFVEVNLHFPPANPWPAFNVADSLLCVGVGLLMICLLLKSRRDLSSAKAA